jgi:hypothetical protein
MNNESYYNLVRNWGLTLALEGGSMWVQEECSNSDKPKNLQQSARTSTSWKCTSYIEKLELYIGEFCT